MKVYIAKASTQSKVDRAESAVHKAEQKIAKLQGQLVEAKAVLKEKKEALKTVKREFKKKEKEKAQPQATPRSVSRPKTPRQSSSKPPSADTQAPMSNRQHNALLEGAKAYDPRTMKGKKWDNLINAGSRFPALKEGYWRAHLRRTPSDSMPFPVKASVSGYNKKEFVAALEAKQAPMKLRTFRGYSPHRWSGLNNHNGEYTDRTTGWNWPQGYITYVQQGVLPSRAFYKYIMGRDNPSLPDRHA